MRELTEQERAEIERDSALPQLDARELVNKEYLERAIKKMYTEVAKHPDGEFHFLTGRPLAEGLGYDTELLDRSRRKRSTPSPGWATTSTSPGWARASASLTSAAGRARTCSAPPCSLARLAGGSGST